MLRENGKTHVSILSILSLAGQRFVGEGRCDAIDQVRQDIGEPAGNAPGLRLGRAGEGGWNIAGCHSSHAKRHACQRDWERALQRALPGAQETVGGTEAKPGRIPHQSARAACTRLRLLVGVVAALCARAEVNAEAMRNFGGDLPRNAARRSAANGHIQIGSDVQGSRANCSGSRAFQCATKRLLCWDVCWMMCHRMAPSCCFLVCACVYACVRLMPRSFSCVHLVLPSLICMHLIPLRFSLHGI